ncbi:MAG: ABC transporter ATP-binding protein [Geminicoccaceae bacterium]|nr:ABC transporter ATP-binding protein [Geminicoccaceae bacterium]
MLEVRGLVAGYHAGAPVVLGVDLELAPGRVLALMGRNGAGKSTLLKAILGLARREAGSIRLDGRGIETRPTEWIVRAGIGFVPQGRGVFPGLTVEQNLRLGGLGHHRPVPPATLYARFPVLAERRDLDASSLSGGEQRQLAIARALAGAPRLLLLDEPSEGIQPSLVDALGATLAALVAAEGIGILLVEQNLELAARLADECLVLEDGRVIDRLPGAVLADEPARIERHLGL